MSQTQTHPRSKPTDETHVPASVDRDADLAATDDLLDSIDEALESNALEITQAYRQRGGQ